MLVESDPLDSYRDRFINELLPFASPEKARQQLVSSLWEKGFAENKEFLVAAYVYDFSCEHRRFVC